MQDDTKAEKNAAETTEAGAERLTAPAFELEQRRQKIQNEVKQDGAGSSDPKEADNQDG